MTHLFSSADSGTQQRWNELRMTFLDRVWRYMLLMTAIAVPVSVSRSFFTGWRPVYTVHLGYLIIISIITLSSERLSYRTRAMLVVGLLDAAGLSGLLNFGLLGSAWWWMFLAGLLAGHFYNRRVELWHVGGTIAAMLLAAGLYVNGTVKLGLDANDYLLQPAAWLTALAGPVMMSVLVFRAVSIYQDAVVALLKEIDSNRREIRELASQLENSLAEIRQLHGLVPMCAHCRKVRDDQGYWDNVEAYVQANSDMKFTHLLCPPCGELLYGDLWHQAVSEVEQEARARRETKTVPVPAPTDNNTTSNNEETLP